LRQSGTSNTSTNTHAFADAFANTTCPIPDAASSGASSNATNSRPFP